MSLRLPSQVRRKLNQSRGEHLFELQKPVYHPVLNSFECVLVVFNAPPAHYRYARRSAIIQAFPFKLFPDFRLDVSPTLE